MFDEITKQKLQYYVYMLVDPINERPFYIGKGKDNRIFDHLNCAINDIEAVSLKYDLIRKINAAGKIPVHIVIRHGLKEEEAFHIEAALIDFAYYIKIDTTNIVGGHNSIEKGLMTIDEIQRLYNAIPLAGIAKNCVIININKNYQRGNDSDAIYRATKETWTMKKNRLQSIQYVLSEYHGLIVEVFMVERWYEKERGYGPNTKKYGQTKIGYGFDGKIAPDDVRNKYINKSIAHIKKKGAANVVRYEI